MMNMHMNWWASFTCSRWIAKSNGNDGGDVPIPTEHEGCQLVKEDAVTLSVEIPDNLPDVYADIDKVEQILTNLVGNAIKTGESD